MTLKKQKGLVSVIIPTFNRRKDLEICLKSVFKQSYKQNEVIVVDDRSTDDTAIYIRKKFPTIKVFENEQNKGPNYCRNLAIVKSKGEYILILDSDAELVNKDQIKNMVMIMSTDSKIGSLGGCYLPNDKRIRACQLNGVRFFDSQTPHHKVKIFLLNECDWIGSNNLFMKKDLLYELKGFDETTIGGETDFEMGMNLKQRGLRNFFGKQIAAKHNQSSSERDNIGIKSKIVNKQYQRELWRTRNRIKYLIKNSAIVNKKTKHIILKFGFVRITNQIISILAFFKQQFLGLKTRNSQNVPSFNKKIDLFSLKIFELFFFIWLIFDSYIWNIINYNKTIKLRKTNFLDKKPGDDY